MNYVLLFASELEADADTEDMEAWMAYMGAMGEAGIMKEGEALQPVSTATSVRIRDGKRQIEDGPFADTREKLGGYVVIDVPDLDTAIEWAARCPGALDGTVEVRPVLDISGDMPG